MLHRGVTDTFSRRWCWKRYLLAEFEGQALVLVPKVEHDRPHTIYIAVENVAERYFESVSGHYFDLESGDVLNAGNKLRMLGESFLRSEWAKRLSESEDFS